MMAGKTKYRGDCCLDIHISEPILQFLTSISSLVFVADGSSNLTTMALAAYSFPRRIPITSS